MTRCFGVLIVQDLVLGRFELMPFPLWRIIEGRLSNASYNHLCA